MLPLRQMRRQARAYAARIDWQRVVERFETLLTRALDERESTSNVRLAR